VFMTFAWYVHLKNLNGQKWYIAALASWGIALFEYLLQVPANRIGYTKLTNHLAVENHAGGHHPVGLRPVRCALHATAAEAGLFMGGVVLDRGGVLYFPFVTVVSKKAGITYGGFPRIALHRWPPCSRCQRR
jgi:Putative member of DMT superfamily (DUF486)